MKNNRKLILGIIIGIIMTSGVGVLAAYFNAEDIAFTPNDSSWEVTNVKEAMDSLYTNVNENLSDKLQFIQASSSYNTGNGYVYANYDFMNNGLTSLEFSQSNFQMYVGNTVDELVSYSHGPLADYSEALNYKYIRFTILCKNGSCGSITNLKYE